MLIEHFMKPTRLNSISKKKKATKLPDDLPEMILLLLVARTDFDGALIKPHVVVVFLMFDGVLLHIEKL